MPLVSGTQLSLDLTPRGGKRNSGVPLSSLRPKPLILLPIVWQEGSEASVCAIQTSTLLRDELWMAASGRIMTEGYQRWWLRPLCASDAERHSGEPTL